VRFCGGAVPSDFDMFTPLNLSGHYRHAVFASSRMSLIGDVKN